MRGRQASENMKQAKDVREWTGEEKKVTKAEISLESVPKVSKAHGRRKNQSNKGPALNHAHIIYEEALKVAQNGENRNNLVDAIPMLEAAYRAGSPEAANALANLAHYGAYDSSKLIELLKYAASKGNAEACFALASKYEGEKNSGVRKNERRAFVLYLTAALAGDADAYLEVGRCYNYGIGVNVDKQLARVWLQAGRKMGGIFVEREV